MNISSFDQDSFLLSDYEMDDMEYSPSPSPSASPLMMHPDITNNIMTSPSIPSSSRKNNCCGHDPYFNIMEICQFCNNEICSSCRIKSVSSSNDNNISLPSQQQNHNNKTSKITKSHDIDQYDPYSYSQSLPTIEKYQCKACTIKQEEESMTNIISSALNESKLITDADDNHEVHIISIIAQYAVGHIIKCCDSSRNCTNDISISNRFDFESEFIDSDNKKIINIEYYETHKVNSSNTSESNECEHASIHAHSEIMTSSNPFKMEMDHSIHSVPNLHDIHIQQPPNLSRSNYHRHGMDNKVKVMVSPPLKKQNKHKEDGSIPVMAMDESKQMNSNYVDIYGQRRTVFCNDCHNAKRSATTPFMMLMATKRFQKNQFGVYE